MKLTQDDNLNILKEIYPNKNYFPKESNYCCCLGHKDSKPSLGINRITGQWHCFSCGESGITLDSLYYKVFNRHYKTNNSQEYKPFIRDSFSFNDNDNVFNIKNIKFYSKPIINKEIVYTYDDLRDPINKDVLLDLKLFFSKRAFNLTDIEFLNKKYNANIRISKYIEFLLEDDTLNKFTRIYRNKVVFPQQDYITRETLNYELRKIFSYSSDPKVIRPAYCKSKFLNSYTLLDYNKTLYLHEGLMDALVFLLYCEETNTACTNGCELSNEILSHIVKFNNIVVIPDNDKMGYSLVNQILDYSNENLKNINLYILPIPRKYNIKDTTDLALYLKNNKQDLNTFYNKIWKSKIQEVHNNLIFI